MNQIELKKTIRYILDNIDHSRKVKDSAESIKDELIDLTLREEFLNKTSTKSVVF